MNKDRMFKHICWLLDQSTEIWTKKDQNNYELADKQYNEAVGLIEIHFPTIDLTNETKNC